MVGRNCRDRGSKGTGSGSSSSHSGGKDTSNCKPQKMEFTANTAGKHQPMACNTAKEHMLQEIQKDLKNGSDMAVDLRMGSDGGIPTKELMDGYEESISQKILE